MNISEASDLTLLSAKTIRYYEDIGLVRPERASNGYRRFTHSDLQKLTLVGIARGLGFTVEDCRTMLALYEDRDPSSGDIDRIANEYLRHVETKIAALESMRQTLRNLVKTCHGNSRPDCPILDDRFSRPQVPVVQR